MQVFGPETRVHRTELKRARQQRAALPDDAPEAVHAEAKSRISAARERLEWHQRLDIEAGIYDYADEF